MSTKTLRKRIALATVAALGAGVLSAQVASATANSLSASTVIATGNLNVTPGTGAVNPTSVAHVLNIASKISTDGSTSVSTTSGTVSSFTSIGLLSVGDISGTKVAGTTQTATLLSNGKLVVYTTGAASEADLISVTGGTISSVYGADAYKSDSTAAANGGATVLAVAISPASGATTMTVKLYSSNDTAPVTGPTIMDGTYGSTLTGQINVTVAATNASGTVSSAKSGVFLAASGTDTGRTSDSTAVGVGTSDWATKQYANIRVRDAYSVTVGAGYILQATATNGALVKFGAGSSPSNTNDFITTDPDNTVLVVAAPSTAPVTTTVTVTWNGTVIGSKTYTFTGEVAKIVLSSPVIGKTSNTNGNTAKYALFDSAGNALYFKNLGVDSTNTPAGNLVVTSSLKNAIVSDVASDTVAQTDNTGAVTGGKVKFTCGIAGTTPIGVTYTNNSGTIVNSNQLPVSCAGDAVTYTAALDKQTYVPGDVATVTFTFKDSKGNLANDVSTIATTAKKISFDGSQLTTAVTGWTAANANPGTDVTDQGVFQLKFIVGTTSGSYTGIADAALFDSTSTPQSAVTLSYKVSDGATSLNDVLKGIVSLIASINKQIAALAKLVTKKK